MQAALLTAAFLPSLPELMILGMVFVLPFLLLVIALVHALRNPRLTDIERLIWVVVIVFVAFIGPILYLVMGKNGTPRGR